MTGISKRIVIAALMAASAVGLSAQAQPAGYPNRGISFVVPFPAGHGLDIYARQLAQVLSQKLSQSVVVENKPGAAGIIGTQYVAGAKPDGYTMLMGSNSTMAAHASLYKKLPYSPLTSFVPVNALSSAPLIMVASAAKEYRTIEDFIQYAKRNHGKVSYGSPGAGTGSHLAGVLFNATTGTSLQHVPYKESGGLYTDLIAGRIDAAFGSVPAMRPYIAKGTVIPIGVTDNERLKSLSNVRTFSEMGYPITLNAWTAVMMPAGTSNDAVGKMSRAIQLALAAPEMMKFEQESDSTSLSAYSQERLGAFIRKEIELYRQLIANAGVTPD